MSTARDHFDAGIDALGLTGGARRREQAREAFRRAVAADPALCDAWMGLIATGDHSSAALCHAHETSATLYRETRRLGLQDTALGVPVATPGFIEVFTYTPASITLAYISALLTERDYDRAEATLEAFDTAAEPQQAPIWRCLGATLHYVTQRWSDVLEWAGRQVSASMPVADASTEVMAGIAHAGLGQFEVALDRLNRVDPERVSSAAAGTAALYRGLCHRMLGRESECRMEMSKAVIDGQMMREASAAIADPSYGPLVTTPDAIAARVDRWEPTSGPTTDELRQTEQRRAVEKALDDAERDLQSFVGLRAVKSHVNDLKFIQLYDRAVAARGVEVGQRNALHMTLVGPPGTAKTSIARIICKMYFGLGILQSPEFIEVSRKSLVGNVIGETEAKTGQILDSARGRALFIDEAPELYKPDNDRDFGKIALDIIMKFAEDHRDDTMIVLAGYSSGMNRLLSANPGLRSRFPRQLEFVSNTADELVEIADLFATNFHVIVEPEAMAAFADTAKWLTVTPTGNPDANMLVDIAGNGRYVRSVLSEAVAKMKARIGADPRIDMATADLDVLRTVTAEDMRAAIVDILVSAEIDPHAGLDRR